MATEFSLHQLLAALRSARAAGNVAMEEAIANKLAHRPTSDQLRNAYLAARKAGNAGMAQAIGQRIVERSRADAADQGALKRGAEGFAQFFENQGRGLGELVGLQTPADIEAARLAGTGVSESTAGKVGGALGFGAEVVPAVFGGGEAAGALEAASGISKLPTALRFLARTAGAAAGGFAQGAVQPYATAQEHHTDETIGALIGGAAPGVGALAGRTAEAIKRAVEGSKNPAIAAGRVLAGRIGRVARDLRGGSRDQVPGVVRTPAQSMPEHAQIVKEERTLRNGEFGAKFADRDAANDAARKAYLQRFVLSDGQKDAIRAQRQQMADGFMQKYLAGKSMAPAGIYKIIDAEIKAGHYTPGVESALGHIRAELGKDVGADGRIPLEKIEAARESIKGVLHSVSVSTGASRDAMMHFTNPVHDAMDAALRARAAGFERFRSVYAKMSAPLNMSDAVADLLRHDGITTDGRLSASKFKDFMERNRKDRHGITGDYKQAVQNVADSLQNEAKAARRVGASGSNTAADSASGVSAWLHKNPYSRNAGMRERLVGGIIGSAVLSHLGIPFGFLPGELSAEMIAPSIRKAYMDVLDSHVTDARKVADLIDAHVVADDARKAALAAKAPKALRVPAIGAATRAAQPGPLVIPITMPADTPVGQAPPPPNPVSATLPASASSGP